jgi:hypothetical protein
MLELGRLAEHLEATSVLLRLAQNERNTEAGRYRIAKLYGREELLRELMKEVRDSILKDKVVA